MTARPQFSIIVPVYNAVHCLEGALNSALQQSYNNFEVILVDDGSNDGSSELCDRYANEFSNIHAIHLKNSGSLLARHEGFKHAKGEYLVCLDSDDCLRSDALMVLSAVIEKAHPDLILYQFSLSEDYSLYPPSVLDLTPGYHDEKDIDKLRKIICAGQHTNSLWSKVFRRNVMDAQVDYSPYKGLIHGDDLFQLTRILSNINSYYYCPMPLYFYRPSPASVTRRYNPKQLEDLKTVIESLITHADRWGEGCEPIARNGAILQCIYLLHILMNDPSCDNLRRTEFVRLTELMYSFNLFGKWTHDLRADKRLEVLALKHGWFELSWLLSKFAAELKKFRDS